MRDVNKYDFYDEMSDFNHDGKLDEMEWYFRDMSECYDTADEQERQNKYRYFGISESDQREIERVHGNYSGNSSSSDSSGGTGCGTLFMIMMAFAFIIEWIF